ncbi:MAG: Crp/Fnr family transcriptional regulator [Rhodospirillales bacterium]|nr:Crp/Fnr family transcriptional regulator [Rhodospirillales bacterium]
MTEDNLSPGSGELGQTERPRCRPALYEDLAQGARELRQMFGEAPSRIAPAGAILIAPERPSQSLYVLRRGWACRTREWPDGRRVIPEIYVPGDLIGFESALRTRPADEVVAIQSVTLQAVDADVVSGLLAQRTTATYLAWLIGEAQRRAEARADRLARFDAQERLAEMLVDLHERLRRRELVTAGSFNLPLTQQQMADHLGLTVVHVNRTLRLLREEKIAIVDRHVVMLRDMARLRQLARQEKSSATGPKATEAAVERLSHALRPAGADVDHEGGDER